MTFQELKARTGISPRLLRFLITEGLVSKARSTGRSTDTYDEAHVGQVMSYLGLGAVGLRLSDIKSVSRFGQPVVLARSGRVTMTVDPGTDPRDVDAGAVLEDLGTALRLYTSPPPREKE